MDPNDRFEYDANVLAPTLAPAGSMSSLSLPCHNVDQLVAYDANVLASAPTLIEGKSSVPFLFLGEQLF